MSEEPLSWDETTGKMTELIHKFEEVQERKPDLDSIELSEMQTVTLVNGVRLYMIEIEVLEAIRQLLEGLGEETEYRSENAEIQIGEVERIQEGSQDDVKSYLEELYIRADNPEAILEALNAKGL